MLKKISLILMIILYVGAGINHFVHPDFYYPIIPPYLPAHELINTVSGIAEIVLGLLLIFRAIRKIAAYGIIAMLIAFIPAHVYMIQMKGCMSAGKCAPEWLMWVRLFPLQFVLIAWAWWHRR